MQQLRNLINRRNVSACTQVHGHADDVQFFLEVVVECHIVAVAMHYFSMKSVNDEPCTRGFAGNTAQLPSHDRWKVFLERLCEIVDEYIIPKQYMISSSRATCSTTSGNPHSRRVQQEHQYLSSMMCTSQQLPQTITKVVPRSRVDEVVRRTAVDGVFNYASAVLNDGLLLFEFIDSIREGDGERILRCWRAMLIYFQHSRHSNYVKEVVYLQAAVHATATPHLAAQLTWSRVVNTKGKAGHNIPVDLYNEHLNRSLKTCTSSIGANIAEKTIVQCSKSIKGLTDAVQNFDRECEINPASIQHTSASLAKDEEMILEELTKSRVFDYVPGREHRTFKGIVPNLSICVDKEKLVNTITKYKKQLQRKANVAKLYKHKF